MAEQTPKPEEGAQSQQQMQQTELVLNDKTAHSAYCNCARVTATPEEVIVDFGLNPNPFMQGKQEVVVTQRLIMNFYTAKRLLFALHQAVQQHESVYGLLETDIQKRVRGNPAMGRLS